MRILVTNDDGILAPGLAALHAIVADLGEVTVVAPSSPQSATGHGITLEGPLVTERVHVQKRFWGVSVAGRPADCVKLAMHEFIDAPVDLVVSGINPGLNVGVNVLYSGTVAAAAEGAIMGAAAVAFSMARSEEMDFELAGRYCRKILDVLLAGDLKPGHLVNVNLPRLDGRPPRGVIVARQAVAGIHESYDSRTDADGRKSFYLTDEYGFKDPHPESDVVAVHEGYITVTPLHVDLTDTSRMTSLTGLNWDEMSLEGQDPDRE